MTSYLIEIELFGGLRVRQAGGAAVDCTGPLTGALLAYLALGLKRSHTREELMAFLWPEDDPEEARPKLRQALYALRSVLEAPPVEKGSVLRTSRTAVWLASETVRTDVTDFEKGVASARDRADPALRATLLAGAVDRVRGELLPGFYQEAFEAQRSRLAAEHREALYALTRAYQEAGDLPHALDTARRSLSLDPLAEEAHCDLMRLYAAAGQPSAVLRQYQELERILREELDEAPSPAAQALVGQLRRSAQVEEAHSPDRSPWPVDTTPSVPSVSCLETPRDQESLCPGRRSVGPKAMAATVLALLGALLLGGTRWAGRGPQTGSLDLPDQQPLERAADWIRYYPLGRGDKQADAAAITTDPEGNVYVAGFVDTTKTDVDFLLLKYDLNGRLLWQRRCDGPGHDVDRARALAVDTDGSVYVTGDSDNGRGNGSTRLSGLDFLTLKYDYNGRLLWKRTYNGPDDGEDRPKRLLLVPGDGVYVLGFSYSRQGSQDIALVKYASDGRREWVARYDGPSHLEDEPAALARDPRGPIYVVGSSRVRAPDGTQYVYLSLRLDDSGRRIWTRQYGYGDHSDHFARGIGVTYDGDILVIGEGRGPAGTPDAVRPGCVAVKYRPSGDLLWVRGTAEERDRVTDLKDAWVGSDGASIVAGTGIDPSGSCCAEIVTRSVGYSPGGILHCGSVGGGETGLVGITPAKFLWAAGSFWTKGGGTELVTLCYGARGTLVHAWRYSPETALHHARALTVRQLGKSDHAFVAGQALRRGTADLIVLRYTQGWY